MSESDPPSAARRVAEHARSLPHTVVNAAIPVADLVALLPVLDAVGAERGDADWVERLWDVVEAYADMPSGTWTQGGCVELHGTLRRLVKARAALADAERAAEPPAG